MRRVIGALVGLVVLAMTGVAWAQVADERAPLRVGTTPAPPFAMPDGAGDWHGLGIDLWRELAAALDRDVVIEERPFADLLPAVEAGELDAAVAAITITADREERVDFTHPFHTTGLGVAVSQQAPGGHWWRVVQRLASAQFLYVVAALALVLFVAGFLVWLFERRRNPEMFGGPPSAGLGSAFWWSAVTMTTVGYGDKAPQTTGGRAVALVWMFVSIIILSSFTAAITSSLTLSQLGHDLRDVSDLRRVRVGTVAGSTSAAVLAERNVAAVDFARTRDGLAAIAAGRIEAFVQDAPILVHLVNDEFSADLDVLPWTFARQDYGIALPADSALREPLNLALLDHLRSEEWQTALRRYLPR